MRPAADLDTGNHKRLRVQLVVHDALEEHAELRLVHIGGRQFGFMQIDAGSGVVVVLCQDIHLRLGGIVRQGQGQAKTEK